MTNRIFIREVETRHRLIDHHRRRRLRLVEVLRKRLMREPANEWQRDARIGVGEKPALAQRDSHRVEVIVADRANSGLLLLSFRWIGPPVNRKSAPVVARAEWRLRRRAN